ncbi:DUF4262 domain-containing protein [Streptomyces sp. Y7]|uniref:DUF4262 domain-containing protein n=1 Tax=Streptomyces sp. Y7 TaxID=3342392 RepID=UPI00371B16BF
MTCNDPYLRRVQATIAEHGYAVQCVGGDVASRRQPFAYTVGLHTGPDHDYELALSGLDADTSTSVLHSLAAALAERRLKPVDGMEVNGVLSNGYALRLRSVSRPEEFGIINALYGATPPVYQAVWPDLHHRFPGDPDCRLTTLVQPLL